MIRVDRVDIGLGRCRGIPAAREVLWVLDGDEGVRRADEEAERVDALGELGEVVLGDIGEI